MSKLKINEILVNPLRQNPYQPEYDNYPDWKHFTKGRIGRPVDPQKGIFGWAKVLDRVPALFFHSNPYKEERSNTPWRDLIYQERGYVLYNGDNKSFRKKAYESQGNKKVLSLLSLYHYKVREVRIKAPPIIVTRTIKINGLKAFRRFIGYGIIESKQRLVQQYDNNLNVFSNFQFEVTLLSLFPEEELDWRWVEDRKDRSINTEDALSFAPENWKKWVDEGNDCIEKIRFKANPPYTLHPDEQNNMPTKNRDIIQSLLNQWYPYRDLVDYRTANKNALRFESMAAFITELYFKECGYNYKTGWMTKGTGDRGVDFVGRLDIGNDSFSRNNLIVLGQSKRYSNQISGESLTRVASRMTRGYMGVVVTLDTFSEPGQREIKDDRLPIIMLNGYKVSQLLLNYMNETRKSLNDIVKERDKWMENNTKEHNDYDAVFYMNMD
jgi:hypothetical protein